MTKLLTLARDLKRRKARERLGRFVAEGVRTAEELLASALPVEGALVGPVLGASERAEALRRRLDQRGVNVSEVTDAEFVSAADTESPQGILLIARIPSYSLASLTVLSPARFLVLDAVQDPGNSGTLLRTAAAFGVHATIAMPGTVDLWNAKVVRSSMGALFRHPTLSATWEELDEFLLRANAELWAAAASGEELGSVSPPAKLALAVGNEGHGLTASCRQRARRIVAIPLTGEVESLNVAVATGIILHHLRP